jgi:hypothetical protein
MTQSSMQSNVSSHQSSRRAFLNGAGRAALAVPAVGVLMHASTTMAASYKGNCGGGNGSDPLPPGGGNGCKHEG